ncbi:MAG: MFS transporter [Flavobacteriaceae bacterium]
MNKKQNYKWFVLIVLTIVYVFNFADRQILIILQEGIKEDLQLSDTQLGLLTGLGFALLYTTLGIPIAKLADKYNRKNILAFSLGFWSLMTVLSGRAQNFFQMLLTRIGVSAGEAGGMPPSHSIISDYFPKEERGTAFSIYSMGVPIGILLGFIVAGSIASEYGWRMAFYALGFPSKIPQ